MLDAADIKAHASSYLLLGLLQRLNKTDPGLIEDLLRGVEAYRKAARSTAVFASPVPQIFDHPIKLLENARL